MGDDKDVVNTEINQLSKDKEDLINKLSLTKMTEQKSIIQDDINNINLKINALNDSKQDSQKNIWLRLEKMPAMLKKVRKDMHYYFIHTKEISGIFKDDINEADVDKYHEFALGVMPRKSKEEIAQEKQERKRS